MCAVKVAIAFAYSAPSRAFSTADSAMGSCASQLSPMIGLYGLNNRVVLQTRMAPSRRCPAEGYGTLHAGVVGTGETVAVAGPAVPEESRTSAVAPSPISTRYVRGALTLFHSRW